MGEEIYFHLIFLSSYSPTPPCYSRTLYVQISTKIIDRVPINSKYQNLSLFRNLFFNIRAHQNCYTTRDTGRACLQPLALLILHRKFLAATSKSEYNDKNQVHWLIGSKKISLRRHTHTHTWTFCLWITWQLVLNVCQVVISFKYMMMLISNVSYTAKYYFSCLYFGRTKIFQFKVILDGWCKMWMRLASCWW